MNSSLGVTGGCPAFDPQKYFGHDSVFCSSVEQFMGLTNIDSVARQLGLPIDISLACGLSVRYRNLCDAIEHLL